MDAPTGALACALVLLGSSGAFVAGCRKDAPSSSADARDANANAGTDTAEPAASSSTAARAARDVEVRAEAVRRDAGALDPACEGPSLSLLHAAVDARCALPEREWRALVLGGVRPDGGGGGKRAGLRQEAHREGGVVILSLVNGGAAPLDVPLRFHPAHPELAFSVLAQDDEHAVFELAPPTPEAPRTEDAGAGERRRAEGLLGLDAGSAFARVHTARIRLPPGGVARARIEVDAGVVRRLDDRRDAGSATPARLPKGRHVVLHVGQLVAAIDAGEPARVDWDAP